MQKAVMSLFKNFKATCFNNNISEDTKIVSLWRWGMDFRITIRFILAGIFFFYSTVCFALPEGYDVQAGSAEFSQPDSNTLDINTSDRVIINYNSFSIANPEAVNFNQPGGDSVALNRVTGGSISEILGSLTANGKIFLVNPNGVLFGPNSSVDVAALVASTLDIDNNDFLNSNYTFREYSDKVGSSVINQGYIQAKDVALIGQAVNNEGTIVTTLGSTVLASGSAMTLSLDTAGMISVAIDEAVKDKVIVDGEEVDSAVENSGEIKADGGVVILTAKIMDDVFDYAVNNEGIIEANSLNNKEGRVELTAEGDIKSTGNISVLGGEIQVCTDDSLILGGTYSADSIVFDPVWVAQVADIKLYGDTTYWATGDININADVKASGALSFFADAINVDNDREETGAGAGIGDFIQAAGTLITAIGDVTISGVNVTVDDVISEHDIDISADNQMTQLDSSELVAVNDMDISGAALILYDMYFGGGSFTATSTGGSIDLNGVIKSAVINLAKVRETVSGGGGGDTSLTLFPVEDSYTNNSYFYSNTNYGSVDEFRVKYKKNWWGGERQKMGMVTI